MKLKNIVSLLPALLICGLSGHAIAGGVTLASTRIIYPADATQSSIAISNHSTKDMFLVQSWVTDNKGNKTHDFIVTPPLFLLKPEKENSLRIELTGKPAWPGDRESLYYFNSKAIPSVPKGASGGNSLQIATQSVIKMFIRPAGLASSVDEAPASLTCAFSGHTITVANPSPYYVSMVNLASGSEELPSTMVAPKSSATLSTKQGNPALSFQTVNDFGAITVKQQCHSA